MPTRPRISIWFRARSYSDEERATLANHLEPAAVVDLHPLQLPEAGGTAELWAVIDFAKEAVTAGVLGNAAYDALKGVCRRLAAWWAEAAAEREIAPEVTTVRVRLGDLVIEVADATHDFSPDAYFMSGPGLALIPRAIEAVLGQLPAEVRSAEGVQYVRVEVAAEHHDSTSPFVVSRYWRIGLGAPNATHLYDSWYGTVGPLPVRNLRSGAIDPDGPG